MYRRITKQEARACFAMGLEFYLCPCKMYPSEYIYSPQCWIDSKKYLLENYTFNQMLKNWEFYNTSYELGYYAHYYVKEPQ